MLRLGPATRVGYFRGRQWATRLLFHHGDIARGTWGIDVAMQCNDGINEDADQWRPRLTLSRYRSVGMLGGLRVTPGGGVGR